MTLTPKAFMESIRGKIPAKVPATLKALSLISYITTSDVAGTSLYGVPYCKGSLSTGGSVFVSGSDF